MKNFVEFLNEADDRTVTLNVTISNIDESTAQDFLKMFAFMEWCGNVGSSRGFEAFFDGDGHFRPNIKVEGRDIKKLDFTDSWNEAEDKVTLDFGA
jgi:hypothetical protein